MQSNAWTDAMTRTRKHKRRDNRCPDCVNSKCDYCRRGDDRRDARRIPAPDGVTHGAALRLPKRKPR